MTEYIETTIKRPDDLFMLAIKDINSFIFRGQNNSEWYLKTGIERTPSSYNTITNEEEISMLEHFRSKYYNYSNGIKIKEDCDFSCLSTIQHYDGITRLLDFTHSLFIAIYFAIENKNQFLGDLYNNVKNNELPCCSVWFINELI